VSSLPAALRERAADIALLVLDVDGVLTDGTLYYGEHGELIKAFNVKDGLGIRLLMQEGVEVAVISARKMPALERRLKDLKVTHAYLGCEDKLTALEELTGRLSIDMKRVAFVGDDIIDLPALRKVGLAVTVQDGNGLVRKEAAWVTEAKGGRGAVREVAEALLEARGKLEAAVERLL